MTLRSRPAWLIRLRMAWQVFRTPSSLIDPMRELRDLIARRRTEAMMAGVGPDGHKVPTHISDELQRFDQVKASMAALIDEHERKPLYAGEIIERLRRVLTVLGYERKAADAA